MQQCTHFQRKHCLRGASCLFLHVLERIPMPGNASVAAFTPQLPPPFPIPASRGLFTVYSPDRMAPVNSSVPPQDTSYTFTPQGGAQQAPHSAPLAYNPQQQFVYMLPQGGVMPNYGMLPMPVSMPVQYYVVMNGKGP